MSHSRYFINNRPDFADDISKATTNTIASTTSNTDDNTLSMLSSSSSLSSPLFVPLLSIPMLASYTGILYHDTVEKTRVTTSIVQIDENTRKDFTLYTGTGGILYLVWYLYQSSSYHHTPRILSTAVTLLDQCDVILHHKLAKGSTSVHVPTFLLGPLGIYTLGCIVTGMVKDTSRCNSYIDKFVSTASDLVSSSSSSCSLSNELLYGRAGILYGYLFLRKYFLSSSESLNTSLRDPSHHHQSANRIFQHTFLETVILPILNTVLDQGKELARTLFPSSSNATNDSLRPAFMWEWHGKLYLGAAHGVVGILHVLLHFIDHLDSSTVNDIDQTIDYLVSLRYPSGNLPSSLSSSFTVSENDDRLVQWCHGAPGFVLTLLLAYEKRDNVTYLQSARESLDVIRERGLVKKLSLCHSIAGNLLVFLAAARTEAVCYHRLSRSSTVTETERTVAVKNIGKNVYRAEQFAKFLLTGGENDSLFGKDNHIGSNPFKVSVYWEKLVDQHKMHGGDHEYSLFEGKTGLLYSLSVLQNILEYVQENTVTELDKYTGIIFPGYDV